MRNKFPVIEVKSTSAIELNKISICIIFMNILLIYNRKTLRIFRRDQLSIRFFVRDTIMGGLCI